MKQKISFALDIFSSSYHGMYEAYLDTESFLPFPYYLRVRDPWTVREITENDLRFRLFAGIAKITATKPGGPACLYGDSEADDAEFVPVKGEEVELLVFVLFDPKTEHGEAHIIWDNADDVEEKYKKYLLQVERIR